MNRPGVVRWCTALLTAMVIVCGPAAIAHADAAGPTDYRTEVVAVEPASDAVAVSIVGGDAFVRIAVQPGHDVVVLGYASEPYLRITDDGVVEENALSYATYYNRERYGADAPDSVDNAAPPQWRTVGHGGVWAWHDHRAHWMERQPPIGLTPGDALPDSSIALLVDGVPTEVVVRTTLLADASPVPAALGLAAGFVALALIVATRRRQRWASVITLTISAAAFVVGLAEFVSLPPETGPRYIWWVLPAIACLSAVGALAVRGPLAWLWRAGALALAGLDLTVWAWPRRAGWTAAIVPTDLPADVDRFVSAATLVFGPGVAVIALAAALAHQATVGQVAAGTAHGTPTV